MALARKLSGPEVSELMSAHYVPDDAALQEAADAGAVAKRAGKVQRAVERSAAGGDARPRAAKAAEARSLAAERAAHGRADLSDDSEDSCDRETIPGPRYGSATSCLFSGARPNIRYVGSALNVFAYPVGAFDTNVCMSR